MINIDDVKKFAEPYYKDKDIMHDMLHIDRVLKYVVKLMNEGNYRANLDVLTCSAYFHGFIYNSEQIIRKWLQQQGEVYMINELKIELIIFDLDGLMFDTEKISFISWRDAAVRYGYHQ